MRGQIQRQWAATLETATLISCKVHGSTQCPIKRRINFKADHGGVWAERLTTEFNHIHSDSGDCVPICVIIQPSRQHTHTHTKSKKQGVTVYHVVVSLLLLLIYYFVNNNKKLTNKYYIKPIVLLLIGAFYIVIICCITFLFNVCFPHLC